MQERPPPVITISDPARPGAFVDQIGSGPESEPWRLPRWRPGRRTLALLVVLQVLVLMAVPAALLAAYRDHERTLDRQALEGIRLRVVERVNLDLSDPSQVSLLLKNAGRLRLELVSARVDRDTTVAYPIGMLLSAGDLARIDLPMEKACPRRLPLGGPTGVLVTVRTSRGQHRTVRVPVRESSFSGDYFVAQQEFCGLYDLTESLRADLVAASVQGHVLTLLLDVSNGASLPRTLTSLRGPPSLALVTSPPLPLALEPAVDRVLTRHTITVRVTVRSCAQARRLVNGGFDPNRPQPVPSLLPGVDERLLPDRFPPTDNPSLVDLVAGVSGDDRQEQVGVYLSDQLLPAVTALVAASC